MSPPDRHPIRLVIQLVHEGSPPRPRHRVVAYPAPKGEKLRPVNFSSRTELEECLQAALPDFDLRLLAAGEGPQVLFAGDVEVTLDQLAALGLRL